MPQRATLVCFFHFAEGLGLTFDPLCGIKGLAITRGGGVLLPVPPQGRPDATMIPDKTTTPRKTITPPTATTSRTETTPRKTPTPDTTTTPHMTTTPGTTTSYKTTAPGVTTAPPPPVGGDHSGGCCKCVIM